MIAITLNGEARTSAARTIADLILELGLDPNARGIAVACNHALVPRSAWPTTPLSAADTVEVIRAVQGG